MPEPRSLYVIMNQRQDRWRLEPDRYRRNGYAKTDALPLPPEAPREPARSTRRLVLRLRTLIRQAG